MTTDQLAVKKALFHILPGASFAITIAVYCGGKIKSQGKSLNKDGGETCGKT
jgi:hypothetical protein